MAIVKIFTRSKGSAACKSCGQPIVWAELVKTGARMPFDYPIRILERLIPLERVDGRDVEEVDDRVSPSHFATCPQAKQWRGRGRRR